ncbi:hypothetical protein [Dictyobacter formicarum]|uniref:DUF4878 domain-containing protein n=1 Tax=Dictyobacter formicarum TaxID=2778368 RepID=A0ABQ3VSB0_9CHLR|nr:hypothetical protein [Dictyobacter formicarum]GHO88762.1 hypothetical protein KSZ_67680 [Dictyobacter formicarum]
MQSSDQSPEDKQSPTTSDHTLESSAADASIPETQREQGPRGTNAREDVALPAENSDALRQGQIYPPPPSFYEKELAKLAPPATPLPSVAHPDPIPSARPHEPQNRQPQPGYGVPYPPAMTNQPGGGQIPPPGYPAYPQGQQYPGMLPPPFVAGPPPAKQSRKWIWILISVLAVIVIASCGLCAWASSSLIGKTYSQTFNAVINSNQLINDYYSAVQNKQYTQAYNYLSPQGSLKDMSRDQFIAQAIKRDELYGSVLRYTPSQPQLNPYNGSNLDSLSINVDIARQKKSYTAHLQLKLINNQWKIVSYDQF